MPDFLKNVPDILSLKVGRRLPASFRCGSGRTPHYRYLQLADQVEKILQDINPTKKKHLPLIPYVSNNVTPLQRRLWMPPRKLKKLYLLLISPKYWMLFIIEDNIL